MRRGRSDIPLLRLWWIYGRFLLSHAVLIMVSLAILLPFAWMLLVSFKPLEEVSRLNPWPRNWRPDNYADVFRDIPFARYFFNSIFVALWVTFLQVFTSAMAAYAFSRIQWPGRDVVFRLYLTTLMVPSVVVMIPNYTLMVKLHMLDSYIGLIVPSAFTAFGTFLLRQFMLTIHRSLDEAAAMDGATHWQTFWEVIMPLVRPGMTTLAVLTFMGNYGLFFWPLVMIKSEYLRTLPIGMMYFDTVYGRQTNLIMAASLMSLLPLILMFVFAQKFIIRGIQLGAVKE
ncbi:MAG: carbohydrate ABC transporter permease [Candidatus Sumerlaeaceae bacterium]